MGYLFPIQAQHIQSAIFICVHF